MRQVARTTLLATSLAALGGTAAWLRAAPSRSVRDAFDAWARGTGSPYDLMGADAEIVIPGGAPHCGTYRKDVFVREVAAPFGSRFTRPPVPVLRRLWVDAGTVVVLADATGIARDGRPYANEYVFIFDMAGSRVRRVTEFLDMAAFNAIWDEVEPGPAADG